MGEMEDFKLAPNRVYGSVRNLENKAHRNNQIVSTDYHHQQQHHYHHHHKHIVRVRAIEHHHHHQHLRTSNTIHASSWNKNDKNKNHGYTINKSLSWISDPEIKRQQRVVKYKAYGVEGKMKSTFRNGFRWVKNKCCQLVHGY